MNGIGIVFGKIGRLKNFDRSRPVTSLPVAAK
jgi:hypothetical protein